MFLICRRTFLTSLAAFCVALPVSADVAVFYAESGVAISGYDPVTYFDGESPKLGHPEHSVTWKGATWHFATARNREIFESNPRAYAPQFGGYCAFAVSRGYTAASDPGAYRVHEGRLYFVHNKDVQSVWQTDLSGNIARADENWPSVLFD